MIRLALAAAFVLLASAPARAAETVTISTADCRRLVAHASSADYRAGVDVRGKPVVPADLNAGAAVDLPAVIEIPLAVDVVRRLHGDGAPGNALPSARRGVEGKTPLGVLTIKGNDAFWNGTPLQSRDETLLAEACRSSLQARGIVLPAPKPAVPE